jgi:hypothetical protein
LRVFGMELAPKNVLKTSAPLFNTIPYFRLEYFTFTCTVLQATYSNTRSYNFRVNVKIMPCLRTFGHSRERTKWVDERELRNL